MATTYDNGVIRSDGPEIVTSREWNGWHIDILEFMGSFAWQAQKENEDRVFSKGLYKSIDEAKEGVWNDLLKSEPRPEDL
jgi:hypothetical protein